MVAGLRFGRLCAAVASALVLSAAGCVSPARLSEPVGPGVSREAAVAVANKWSHEIIVRDEPDRWVAVKLATLLDPYVHEVYAGLDEGSPDFATFVSRLGRFAGQGTVHIQHVEAFQGQPGNMPWGRIGLRVVYRRLLPSEVRAMAVHTGKPAGCCESLAYLFSALLRLKGAAEDDVVHLRMRSHSVTVVRYGGQIYGTNNNAVGPFTPRIRDWHTSQKYVGVLGEHFAGFGRFRLDAAFFAAEGPLLERLGGRIHATVYPDYLEGVDVRDRLAIQRRLFVDLRDSAPRMSLLVRYAAQSLDVPDRSVYEEAAMRGPVVRGLSRTLSSVDEVAAWIAGNIGTGSVFADGDSRLLMPDQVIVYRTGHALDKALLARTLLALRGIEATISGSAGAATLQTSGRVLEFR